MSYFGFAVSTFNHKLLYSQQLNQVKHYLIKISCKINIYLALYVDNIGKVWAQMDRLTNYLQS